MSVQRLHVWIHRNNSGEQQARTVDSAATSEGAQSSSNQTPSLREERAGGNTKSSVAQEAPARLKLCRELQSQRVKYKCGCSF